jgi:hypothetical protein
MPRPYHERLNLVQTADARIVRIRGANGSCRTARAGCRAICVRAGQACGLGGPPISAVFSRQIGHAITQLREPLVAPAPMSFTSAGHDRVRDGYAFGHPVLVQGLTVNLREPGVAVSTGEPEGRPPRSTQLSPGRPEYPPRPSSTGRSVLAYRSPVSRGRERHAGTVQLIVISGVPVESKPRLNPGGTRLPPPPPPAPISPPPPP